MKQFIEMKNIIQKVFWMNPNLVKILLPILLIRIVIDLLLKIEITVEVVKILTKKNMLEEIII